MTEIMGRPSEDTVECLCGNRPWFDGFYVSEADGTTREGEYGPDTLWDGETMACRGCGRIFSLTTNVVSGRATPWMLLGAALLV